MSLPQLLPWAWPRGQLGSGEQLARPTAGTHGRDAALRPASLPSCLSPKFTQLSLALSSSDATSSGERVLPRAGTLSSGTELGVITHPRFQGTEQVGLRAKTGKVPDKVGGLVTIPPVSWQPYSGGHISPHFTDERKVMVSAGYLFWSFGCSPHPPPSCSLNTFCLSKPPFASALDLGREVWAQGGSHRPAEGPLETSRPAPIPVQGGEDRGQRGLTCLDSDAPIQDRPPTPPDGGTERGSQKQREAAGAA